MISLRALSVSWRAAPRAEEIERVRYGQGRLGIDNHVHPSSPRATSRELPNKLSDGSVFLCMLLLFHLKTLLFIRSLATKSRRFENIWAKSLSRSQTTSFWGKDYTHVESFPSPILLWARKPFWSCLLQATDIRLLPPFTWYHWHSHHSRKVNLSTLNLLSFRDSNFNWHGWEAGPAASTAIGLLWPQASYLNSEVSICPSDEWRWKLFHDNTVSF